MNPQTVRQYYARQDIQQAMLSFTPHREITGQFEGYFGKRPDVMELPSDFRVYQKQGVRSLHMSEERWENPLMLGNEKSDEDRAKNRIGWDLILDLDGKEMQLARIVGDVVIRYLQRLGVHNVSVKFSGNKGFHIGVPFEAFSREIVGLGETRLLFPEAPRRVSSFLLAELRGEITKRLLEYGGSIEELAKKYDMDPQELASSDEKSHYMDFMKIIEIDTILIASRHLFRMPYSLHEKSGLVSIPIPLDALLRFDPKKEATPDQVDPSAYASYEFLAYNSQYGKDADILLSKAYEDDYEEMMSHATVNRRAKDSSGTHFEITEEVAIKEFPQSIQYLLNHPMEDGRKRALFLLLSFLHSIKWDEQHIKETIWDWNKRQHTPLRENYVTTQIQWFANQQRTISPPNFEHNSYYEGIGIPKEVVDKDAQAFRQLTIKNPLQYVYHLKRAKQAGKKKSSY